MDLWLLRHAAAEDRAASGRDADRSLTPEGLKRAEAVARGLAALKPGIHAVWTSPFRRARETADAAARALGLEKALRETRSLEPGRDPGEILEEVAAEEADGILLVGHEPHLGALLGRLVAVGAGTPIPLKKAAIARVQLETKGRGSLRAMLPPKVLELLARSKRG